MESSQLNNLLNVRVKSCIRILFISKAGQIAFFERSNVESNDFEKLKQFFDEQNILWETQYAIYFKLDKLTFDNITKNT